MTHRCPTCNQALAPGNGAVEDVKCDNSNACLIPAATSSVQPTEIKSGNSPTAPVTELPDAVRIPLHSLQADLEYLIGRVIADGSCGAMVIKSMRERLDQIEVYVAAPSPAALDPVTVEALAIKIAKLRFCEKQDNIFPCASCNNVAGYNDDVGCITMACALIGQPASKED